MLSTEFKHGPLSAVTEGFPVLFSVDPLDVPVIVSGINEVTCRGGRGVNWENLRTANRSDYYLAIYGIVGFRCVSSSGN